MQQDDGKRLSVRMDEEEMEHIEQLREKLKARFKHQRLGNYIRVTQKTVILEALEALEQSLMQEAS